MTFAEKLKSERKRIGLTQPATAALLELKDRTYWEYEAGASEPPAITQEGALARLAKIKTKAKS
jgi:transcriptional regulator with XRE-family HTH domain